ncbi:MAG: PspC domain-containing protein [Candidatus Staskawiczbacteria bacterium]|nr:PspC domain-containing protein [Candidatus Staskawiczbacteria bacterium]
MKRLYKSKDNKVFCGVIGGVGEYFDVDPVLLRVVWLLIVVFTGIFPGIIAYILACIVVPQKPPVILQ